RRAVVHSAEADPAAADARVAAARRAIDIAAARLVGGVVARRAEARDRVHAHVVATRRGRPEAEALCAGRRCDRPERERGGPVVGNVRAVEARRAEVDGPGGRVRVAAEAGAWPEVARAAADAVVREGISDAA